MRARYAAAITVFLALFVCADVAVERASGARSSDGFKVLLIGLDGADPDFLMRLVEQGKLPHFERLLKEGAFGRCQTFRPTKSVVVWTSVATGKKMEKHGVVDWTVRSADGRQRLSSGHDRKAAAIWNIATSYGKRVGLVNWWATWPAEPINGEMVSNHFVKALHRPIEDATYPAALYGELQRFALIDREAVRDEMERAGFPVYTPERAEAGFKPSDNYRANFRQSVDLYIQDKLVEDVSHYILTTHGRYDYFGVIFRNLDIFSHFAWRLVDRRIAERVFGALNGTRKPLTPELESLMDDAYTSVLEPIYEHADARLGRFLARADSQTVVVVVSDHGFQFRNDPRDPSRRFGFYHYDGPMAPDGVIFFWGPPIRPGARLSGASVFDVCPTILYLLGIPAGRDMDGRVLSEMIEPARLAANPVPWVKSHESIVRGRGGTPSPLDGEILEELRSLGYIQ